MTVNLDCHNSCTALMVSAQREPMYVYTLVCQNVCYHGNHTGNVIMGNHQCIGFTGNRYLCIIDFIDNNIAAADGCTANQRGSSRFICQRNFRRIGVCAVNIFFDKGKIQTFLCRNLHAVADTGIVCVHPQNPCNHSLIRTVTLIGLGKGAAELNHSLHGFLAQNRTGIFPDTHCTCCMRTGRTNHNRSDDIKYL